MRPGLLCPGRDKEIVQYRLVSDGFNEAGAFMPRKALPKEPGQLAPSLLQ